MTKCNYTIIQKNIFHLKSSYIDSIKTFSSFRSFGSGIESNEYGLIIFAFLFLLSSFVTQSFCNLYELKVNFGLWYCRMSPCDVFGGILIALTLFYFKRNKYTVPTIYKFAFLFWVSCFFSFSYAQDKELTALSLLIILYCILLSLSFFNVFNSKRKVILLVKVIFGFISILALIALYDIVANYSGLPNIFKPREIYRNGVLVEVVKNEVLLGFRNSSHLGSFFYFYSIAILPVVFMKDVAISRKHIAIVLLFLSIIMAIIVISYKIMAIIALVCSFTLMLIFGRNRLVLSRIFGFLLLVISVAFITTNIDRDINRKIRYKIQQRVTLWFNPEYRSENSTDKFLIRNYKNAWNAFKKYPITGIGLGNYKYIDKNEVHNTPLLILSDAGLLGLLSFLLFVFYFIRRLYGHLQLKLSNNGFSNYYVLLSILLIGSFPSWLYDINIRKREYWVVLAISMILLTIAERSRHQRIDSKEIEDV